MKKAMVLVLAFYLSVTSFYSQQYSRDLMETHGMANGRQWEGMGPTRVLFLQGLMEGLMAGLIIQGAEARLNEFFPKNFSRGEIADEIDRFYRDRSNVRIPVFWIYILVIQKIKGGTPAELEERLANLRKQFNE